jgi:hypothetical protein
MGMRNARERNFIDREWRRENNRLLQSWFKSTTTLTNLDIIFLKNATLVF